MGLSQYLGNVLDAAATMRDRTDIEVLLVGDGATRRSLETKSSELQLKNVRFLPYQPRDELSQSLSAADMHLISMHPLAHHCLMPSKLYGILASGTPVLAIAAPDSELATLIDDWQVGFTVPPGDPKALATTCAGVPITVLSFLRWERELERLPYKISIASDKQADLRRFCSVPLLVWKRLLFVTIV